MKTSLKFAVITLALCLTSLQAFAADVKLDAGMDAALKKLDANFQVLSTTVFAPTVQGYFDSGEYPMALFSDFNRDNRRDVVVMGTTGKGQRIVVAIISSRKGYQAQRVDGLVFEDPKKAKFGEESGLYQFLSPSDARGSSAFQWENVLSLSRPVVIFVWNGNGFVASK